MPCACSNRAAAALLPLPMPPVRPMISLSEKVIAIPTRPAQFKGRQYTEKGGQGCSARWDASSPGYEEAGFASELDPGSHRGGAPTVHRVQRPPDGSSYVGAPAGTPDRPGANDGPVNHQTP